ncbi:MULTISPECIES: 23S rRNA (guanosine(2251)-2'-O)-methyltransferase RlmB [unclassified Mycoplasma]|uniref:23S rRNA (guanosine(2251)-2'-O)-methyltransferase RlmB n=1 Tax=unclassified Mycoplasma TaxID=2683645 RepID=UPI00211C5820|nr:MULTISPECIES: 23S rRNA (guanosine(2251)-2'-O)-methyltransferase RlmB [unclassified Mycoplasma]UUM19569.1 23S rRNA (guanosine(2251)-2'-O)-methyltransferase RlmB [Mycoplasma sp. 1578d]UUM24488.1 23S rRNA (guanosine(2251)-2'-O)-methyltransferase RlmB [Mycoplasma sp. 3686d]
MHKFIISGKNSVLEAYKNNLPILKILVSKKEHASLFDSKKTMIQIVDSQKLNQISKENHQGFIAYLQEINYKDTNHLIKTKPKGVLVLDKIQDPHNFGAIIRTANAAGIKDIIYPKENSCDITPTVLKVASGGFVNMNFYRVNSISATITKLKKAGFWAYATTLNSNSVNHSQVNYNTPSLLIIGNEGNGISKSVLSVADQSVYIKQYGSVQSLNASVATGIILFDFANKVNEE